MDEKNYEFGPRKETLSLSATPFINKGLVEPILVYLYIYLFIYFFSVGRYTCERVAGIFWWQWAFSRVFRWSTEVPERSAGIGLHRKWIKLFRFCCFRGEGTNTTQDCGSYLSALKHIFKQVTAGTTINNHSSHQNFHILETFLIYPGIKYEPTLTLWPDFHFSRLTPIFRASTRYVMPTITVRADTTFENAYILWIKILGI